MVGPEQQEATAAILRQPTQGVGTRRLPGLDNPGAVVEAARPDSQAQTMAALRTNFATELASLEREARVKGLAEARQEAAKELASTLAKAQEEQALQWQKKEESLRLDLEGERLGLADLAGELRKQSEQLIAAMEPIVGRLALAVVIRLLGQHLVSRALVADLAAQAVEEYRLSEPVRIRVSAADFESIRSSASQGTLLASFQVDHEADVGSCMIDYGSGQLDAGLDTQLATLKELLLPRVQGDGCVGRA